MDLAAQLSTSSRHSLTCTVFLVVVMAAGSQDASGFRAHSPSIQAFLAFQVAFTGVSQRWSVLVSIKVSSNRAWRSLLPSGGIAAAVDFGWIPRGSLLTGHECLAGRWHVGR